MNFLCRPPRTEYGSIPLKQLFHVKSATPEILLPSIIYFSKLYGIYCGAEGNSSLWNFNFTVRARTYVGIWKSWLRGFFFFFIRVKINDRLIFFFLFFLKIERETGSNRIECTYIFEIKFKSFFFCLQIWEIFYMKLKCCLVINRCNYLEGFFGG